MVKELGLLEDGVTGLALAMVVSPCAVAFSCAARHTRMATQKNSIVRITIIISPNREES
jgi:hypothetical protein